MLGSVGTVLRSATAGPWSMKLVYLLYYMAMAVYLTYLSLYLHAIHLSGAQIGFIASIVPLAGVALQPLWGFLSDRYRWRKQLLALSLLCAALIAPVAVLVHSFLVLAILILGLAITLSPTVPLADATTLEWLSRHGGSYGPVRFYGSLGFLVSSLVVGPLLAGSRIHILFPIYAVFLAATFLASLAAPRQQAAKSGTHRGGMRLILRDRMVITFLVLVAAGFGTAAAYNTFFALYMHDLGASTTIIGVAVGLSSLSELPVMALSGRFIARFGVKPLLLVGFSAAATRWLAYGLLHDWHIALIFQLLHGLSFAGTYVACVTFVDLEVPAQLRSTGQTLLYGATFGVGAVLGANLFGRLFDRLQAGGMFLVAAAICGAVVVAIAVFVPNKQVSPAVEAAAAQAESA